MSYLFTSESVTIGHPDKLCDFVADSILDYILSKDKDAHVACEVTAIANTLNIMGEINTKINPNYEKIARDAIRKAGYTKEEYGFSDKCHINLNIHAQSQEINNAVIKSEGDIGAGDQGIMFGYACDETENFMPFAIDKAHLLTKKLRELRENGTIGYLRPDGKSQVTAEFDDNSRVLGIKNIVLSTQSDEMELDILKKDIKEKLIFANIDEKYLKNTQYFINPSGSFVLGGPAADSGLTGRKIIVDTYGGSSCHGGGAFSGKDPTKVDRSASLMLRRIAKTIVHNGYAKKCELQVAYAIGVPEPVGFYCRTFGTGKISDSELIKKIKKFYDLTPRSIIKFLDLQNPVYAMTNDGGAFGNDKFNASWEEVDKSF